MLFDALPGAELNRAPLPAIQDLVLLLHEPPRSTFVSFSSMRAGQLRRPGRARNRENRPQCTT
jgi:hypothetical protein